MFACSLVPRIKYPIFLKYLRALTKFVIVKIWTASVPPAETCLTIGVMGEQWCLLIITPAILLAAADLMQAPRFLGSITLSISKNVGFLFWMLSSYFFKCMAYTKVLICQFAC